MDTTQKFSSTTIALHWLVAVSIIGLIALGIYMVETESWPLYHLHKSIGLLAFAAILARLAWRWRNGLAAAGAAGVAASNMRAATVAAHVVLLILTVVLPLTGMLYSGASGQRLRHFRLGDFPQPLQRRPGRAVQRALVRHRPGACTAGSATCCWR